MPRTLLIATMVLVACESAPPGPAAGTERGPCRSDGTCDTPLVCLSDVCVRDDRDGGPAPEDASLDGALDGAIDGAMPADGGTDAGMLERRTWVADSIDVPTDATMSSALGRDLDDDGTIDNQIGLIFSSLQSAIPSIDLQGRADEAVDRGDVILLVEALAAAFTDAPALGRLLEGSAPVPMPCVDAGDFVCRRHLGGDGSFTVVTPAPARFGGTVASSRISLAGGEVRIPVGFGGPLQWITLRDARVEASVTATGLASGRIAGGCAPDELLAAGHASVSAQIEMDCAAGTCVGGSVGEELLALLDMDADGSVSLAEMEANSLIDALLAPDLDLDGDGTNDAVSAGIGFTAVGATFAEP